MPEEFPDLEMETTLSEFMQQIDKTVENLDLSLSFNEIKTILDVEKGKVHKEIDKYVDELSNVYINSYLETKTLPGNVEVDPESKYDIENVRHNLRKINGDYFNGYEKKISNMQSKFKVLVNDNLFMDGKYFDAQKILNETALKAITEGSSVQNLRRKLSKTLTAQGMNVFLGNSAFGEKTGVKYTTMVDPLTNRTRTYKLNNLLNIWSRTSLMNMHNNAKKDAFKKEGVKVGVFHVHPDSRTCPFCIPWDDVLFCFDSDYIGMEVDGMIIKYTLDDAKAAGLFHMQCRDSFSAYIPGILEGDFKTKPQYTPELWKKMNNYQKNKVKMAIKNPLDFETKPPKVLKKSKPVKKKIKNIKEFNKNLSSLNMVKKESSDFSAKNNKLKEKVFNNSYNTLFSLKNRFKFINSPKFRRMNQLSFNDNFSDYQKSVYFSSGNATISTNEDFLGINDKLRPKKGNNFSVNGSFNGNIRNIAGNHIFDNCLTDQEKNKWNALMKKTFKWSGKKLIPATRRKITDKISFYASTSRKTAFVESFNAFTSPDYNNVSSFKLPSEIENFMRELLE